MSRLILRGGRVVDGSGATSKEADIVVEDGRIRDVALLDAELDAEVLDVSGRIVAPGFVDVHAHDDVALLKSDGVEPKLRQGVTTDIVGNCGHGCAPLGADAETHIHYASPILGYFPHQLDWQTFPEYLARLDTTALLTNTTTLVPHGALRASVAGYARRPLHPHELSAVSATLDEALHAGAAGLSLGLMYAPGESATREELLALARIVAKHGKILAAHIRSEGHAIDDSLDELFDLGRTTGARLQLSHLKVISPHNHGRMPELIEQLDEARTAGIDITADVYPYAAGSTTVAALFPAWALADGTNGLLSLLGSGAGRDRVRTALQEPWNAAENNLYALGAEQIVLAGFADNPSYEGKTLATIAAERGQEPTGCLCDLVHCEQARLTVVLFQMSETDVATALSWPWTMIGSDGLPIDSAYTHPRMYGTFPRALCRFADQLEESVRRMTALPCERFGLDGRGILRPGAAADLVVLDPARLVDRADFGEPRRFPTGIEVVLIDGRVAAHETGTASAVGRLLRVSPNGA